jgi:FkbM family methyltransferase
MMRATSFSLNWLPWGLLSKLRTVPYVAPALERAFSLASLPARGKVVSIRSGEAKGLSFRIGRASNIWATGRVETEVQHVLREFVRPGDVFFDVGANVGFFTLLAARFVGPTGTVVAFEPQPENLEALRGNVSLNGFTNVIVDSRAVSSSSGTRVLDWRNPPTARLVDGSQAHSGRSFSVGTTSIDDYVADNPGHAPRMVKIDVEGHELDVIQGMKRTLLEHGPTILCEMHRTNRQLASALRALGYQMRVLEEDVSVEEAPWWAHVIAHPADLTEPRP